MFDDQALKEAIDRNTDDIKNSERVQIAQELLMGVIDILQDVARDTDDRHAKAYMIDHLKILASEGHGFCSRDFNLDEWIQRLEKREEEEDEDEEEEAQEFMENQQIEADELRQRIDQAHDQEDQDHDNKRQD